MTAVAWQLGRLRAGRPMRVQAILMGLVLAMLVVAGAGAASPNYLRGSVALAGVAVFLAACLRSPGRVLVALLVWLCAFGTLRRLLPTGVSGGSDPLLLVAPIVVAILLLVAIGRGAFGRQTRFSTTVLILSGLTVASAMNPLQGGISVGAAGLMFVLVPLLWFWVGRALVTDDLLRRLLGVVSWLALGAAVYGLFQVYIGLPSWDQQWVDAKGYVSLFVARNAIRPFASLSSSSEYVGLLAVGTVLWALRLRRARDTAPAACALGILAWALTVASVRGALVVVPITLGLVFATSRGFGARRTALFGIAALFILGVIVSRLDPGSVGGERTSALVSRSVSGLSDPFDPEVSTLPVHIESLVGGLREAFRNPLGRGVGAITIAADRLGGSNNASTDVDPSNVAVAMGLPGLLAYGALVVLGLRMAFLRARRQRDYLSLAALGIALVTSLQWLNGGAYAVAPLPWLVLGWLDARPPRDLAILPPLASSS
ncbi:MAG TPA: hypothetical protein VM328_02250 [Fimbriimonadaceae bacterium]|nr:hypothetical protein [Fimbriimonadaceae bacterium]